MGGHRGRDGGDGGAHGDGAGERHRLRLRAPRHGGRDRGRGGPGVGHARGDRPGRDARRRGVARRAVAGPGAAVLPGQVPRPDERRRGGLLHLHHRRALRARPRGAGPVDRAQGRARGRKRRDGRDRRPAAEPEPRPGPSRMAEAGHRTRDVLHPRGGAGGRGDGLLHPLRPQDAAAGALGGGRRGRGRDRRHPRLRGDPRPLLDRDGDGGLRHVRRYGERRLGLHGNFRDADLRRGRDPEDGLGAGAGRRCQRGQRDADADAVEPLGGLHRGRRGDGDNHQRRSDPGGLAGAFRAHGDGPGARRGGTATDGAAAGGGCGHPSPGRRCRRGRRVPDRSPGQAAARRQPAPPVR